MLLLLYYKVDDGDERCGLDFFEAGGGALLMERGDESEMESSLTDAQLELGQKMPRSICRCSTH